MLCKPTKYLKVAKQEFENFSQDESDVFLSRAINHNVSHYLAIPCVDKKYENRMQRIWNLMILNIIFKNSSRQYSVSQKNKILNKMIQNNKNQGL